MDQQTLDKFIKLKADGQRTLFFVDHEGLEFLFKPLTLDEYNIITELENFLSGAVINDTLLRITVLFCNYSGGLEKWLFDGKAGHPDFLAQAVIDASGFQSREQFLTILEKKRESASEIQSIIEMYICSAFPSLKPADINTFTLEEQLDLFAKAEQALGKPVDFDKAFSGNKNNTPAQDPREQYSPPPGHQTSELLSSDIADMPNWSKISKGAESF